MYINSFLSNFVGNNSLLRKQQKEERATNQTIFHLYSRANTQENRKPRDFKLVSHTLRYILSDITDAFPHFYNLLSRDTLHYPTQSFIFTKAGTLREGRRLCTTKNAGKQLDFFKISQIKFQINEHKSRYKGVFAAILR